MRRAFRGLEPGRLVIWVNTLASGVPPALPGIDTQAKEKPNSLQSPALELFTTHYTVPTRDVQLHHLQILLTARVSKIIYSSKEH